MPRPSKPVPSYRLHKQSGQAVVTVRTPEGGRKDILLGPYNSPESLAEYQRVVARLRTAAGARDLTAPPDGGPPDLSVNELLLAYLRRPDAPDPGRHPGGTDPRYALRKVRELFGPEPAAEFGPLKLKAVRDAWVADGLSRKVVNGRAGAVKRMFRWAVGEELVAPDVYRKLAAVEGLRAGRTPAPERVPVKPAVPADVAAVLPHLPEPVRALAVVQLHSGARAGELVKMRTGDIDRSDPAAWVYRPGSHKGTWKGKGRVIYLGPRSQEALAPLLLKAGGPAEYVFSPRRAEAERNAARSAGRRTKLYPSHARHNERRRAGAARKRPPGAHYTTGTYRQALERGCEKAGVPAIATHRLRHLAATRVRAELGVDAARALLGHTLASVTEVYSHEVDRQLALKAVEKFG